MMTPDEGRCRPVRNNTDQPGEGKPPPSFAVRWHRLVVQRCPGLTVHRRLIVYALRDLGNWQTGGDLRPGFVRLATEVGVSRWTVIRAFASLVEDGWLVQLGRGHGGPLGGGSASVYMRVVPTGMEDRWGNPNDDRQHRAAIESLVLQRPELVDALLGGPAETSSAAAPIPTELSTATSSTAAPISTQTSSRPARDMLQGQQRQVADVLQTSSRPASLAVIEQLEKGFFRVQGTRQPKLDPAKRAEIHAELDKVRNHDAGTP